MNTIGDRKVKVYPRKTPKKYNFKWLPIFNISGEKTNLS